MTISAHQLESELETFGHHRIEIVAALAHDGPPDGIGPALMLAVGSRETDLRNIVSDPGHGRGWLQIDDRFHPGFLSSHRGCNSGSFTAKFASALPRAACRRSPRGRCSQCSCCATTCSSRAPVVGTFLKRNGLSV